MLWRAPRARLADLPDAWFRGRFCGTRNPWVPWPDQKCGTRNPWVPWPDEKCGTRNPWVPNLEPPKTSIKGRYTKIRSANMGPCACACMCMLCMYTKCGEKTIGKRGKHWIGRVLATRAPTDGKCNVLFNSRSFPKRSPWSFESPCGVSKSPRGVSESPHGVSIKPRGVSIKPRGVTICPVGFP
jgi:hypothetical protein